MSSPGDTGCSVTSTLHRAPVRQPAKSRQSSSSTLPIPRCRRRGWGGARGTELWPSPSPPGPTPRGGRMLSQGPSCSRGACTTGKHFTGGGEGLSRGGARRWPWLRVVLGAAGHGTDPVSIAGRQPRGLPGHFPLGSCSPERSLPARLRPGPVWGHLKGPWAPAEPVTTLPSAGDERRGPAPAPQTLLGVLLRPERGERQRRAVAMPHRVATAAGGRGGNSVPPTPGCHPDGGRWLHTHISPRRSRGRCPGATVRTMRFSRAGGCVRSQWQKLRRCRIVPGGAGPRAAGGGCHRSPAVPTGGPRPCPPPGQGGPRPPHRPGLAVTLRSLPQDRARREDEEPARPARRPGSVLLPQQVTAEPRQDPRPLCRQQRHAGTGTPAITGSRQPTPLCLAGGAERPDGAARSSAGSREQRCAGREPGVWPPPGRAVGPTCPPPTLRQPGGPGPPPEQKRAHAHTSSPRLPPVHPQSASRGSSPCSATPPNKANELEGLGAFVGGTWSQPAPGTSPPQGSPHRRSPSSCAPAPARTAATANPGTRSAPGTPAARGQGDTGMIPPGPGSAPAPIPPHTQGGPGQGVPRFA